MTHASARTNGPDVSVVIAVHNGMPELTRCVTSVLGQTLGGDRVEIIVVDDGSTDETPAELVRLQSIAGGRLQVVTQPPSGGPSRPRNEGLVRSSGRYVFFLDADDYLGTEALERLVATGDVNGADVVLGKIVPAHGGRSPSIFARDDADADLFSSRLIWSLNAQKLFRRETLEDEPSIRFPEELWTGEDAVFTMRAYLRAKRIAVVATYPCYYKVRRPSGGHVTSRPGAEPRFKALRALIEVIAGSTEEGHRRDALMIRPFKVGILQWFGPRFLTISPTERAEVMRLGPPLIRQWLTPGVAARLAPVERLHLHLAGIERDDLLEELLHWLADGRQPNVIVEDGRRYQAYPFLRDPRIAIPDDVFEVFPVASYGHSITGVERRGRSSLRLRASVTLATGSGSHPMQLVLRDRHRGSKLRLPVRVQTLPPDQPGGTKDVQRQVEYIADIDIARAANGWMLADAFWDLYLDATRDGVTDPERLGRRRPEDASPPSKWLISGRDEGNAALRAQVRAYFTERHGALTIRVRRLSPRAYVAARILSRVPGLEQVRPMARRLRRVLSRTPPRRAPVTLDRLRGWLRR